MKLGGFCRTSVQVCGTVMQL